MASARRTTLGDTMQRGVGDEAGRATIDVRRSATPTGVAAYLQVPVKTVYLWRYQKKVPPRTVLAATFDTGGRTWRLGSRRLRPADERENQLELRVLGLWSPLERLSFLMARSPGSPGRTVSPRYHGSSGTPACSISRTISFRRTRRRSYSGACLITSPSGPSSRRSRQINRLRYGGRRL